MKPVLHEINIENSILLNTNFNTNILTFRAACLCSVIYYPVHTLFSFFSSNIAADATNILLWDYTMFKGFIISTIL